MIYVLWACHVYMHSLCDLLVDHYLRFGHAWVRGTVRSNERSRFSHHRQPVCSGHHTEGCWCRTSCGLWGQWWSTMGNPLHLGSDNSSLSGLCGTHRHSHTVWPLSLCVSTLTEIEGKSWNPAWIWMHYCWKMCFLYCRDILLSGINC